MSFDAPLKEPIQRYIDLLPNVKLIRHKKRSGLIVARMIGARLATAPVIIFLDAHTEVNVGWLEPLLDQLRRNRKQVLQPFIDGIDMKTLTFASPGIYYKGAFSWDLRYICLVSSIFPLTSRWSCGVKSCVKRWERDLRWEEPWQAPGASRGPLKSPRSDRGGRLHLPPWGVTGSPIEEGEQSTHCNNYTWTVKGKR